jgi:hypothetical protein
MNLVGMACNIQVLSNNVGCCGDVQDIAAFLAYW